MTTIRDLRPDIDAFEACRKSLEESHRGQFVVFHATAFAGARDSLGCEQDSC